MTSKEMWARCPFLAPGRFGGVVPGLLKWQLEKAGSDKLGRQFTVGKVAFQPWSLELTLHDIAIATAGPSPISPEILQQSPQFSIKRLHICR
ncbi:MAG: hypothetical protein Q8L91_05440 [Polaromonas sp.]|nr:hypothetical protein [Polaromonas sp.]